MEETARPYTKVARAAAEERTRAALLDAAEAAFFAGPWDETSLEALAARAGVTKPTLLRHFGSKDGLLERAYSRAFARVRDQRFGAPTEDIDGALDNLLEHYGEHGDRALRIGAMDGREPLAGLVARAKEMHHDWVDHAFSPWLRRLRGRRRAHTRAALIALCDVHTWSVMSHDLGMSPRDVHAALSLSVHRLLEEDA